MRENFSGKNNPNWKGGVIDRRGYVKCLKKTHPNADSSGYIWEHHLVMEKKMGRFLKPKEIVHHKNKNKADNRIENLRLFKTNNEHIKFHQMVKRRN